MDISFAWPGLTPETAAAVAAALKAAGYEGPDSFRWQRTHPQEPRPFSLDLMAPAPPGLERGPIRVGGQELAPFWNGEPALRHPTPVMISATMPSGEEAEALVPVGSPTGLLFAKAQIPFTRREMPAPATAAERNDRKHLYDVFAIARTFPGGAGALAKALCDDLDGDQLRHLADVLTISFVEQTSRGPHDVAEEMGLTGEATERQATEVRVTFRRLLDSLADLGV